MALRFKDEFLLRKAVYLITCCPSVCLCAFPSWKRHSEGRPRLWLDTVLVLRPSEAAPQALALGEVDGNRKGGLCFLGGSICCKMNQLRSYQDISPFWNSYLTRKLSIVWGDIYIHIQLHGQCYLNLLI